MNLRDAKKIEVGDVVVTRAGERYKVLEKELRPGGASMVFMLSNRKWYYHTEIQEIESEDFVPRKYYQILAFNPKDKIDEVCSTHIYPTYVSVMSIEHHLTKPCTFEDLYGQMTMLQSNPNDGLKFVDHYNAIKMLDIVKHGYPEKEFHIIEVDALCFGRTKHRWVVNL